MTDLKEIPESEWPVGSYVFDVEDDVTVLRVKDQVGFIYHTPATNKEMSIKFLTWLRDVNDETRMKVIAGIILEYQVSYHLNAESEEKRLQDLNMEDEALVGKILDACQSVVTYDFKDGTYIYVPDVHKKLREDHLDVPKWVVFSVLKTVECAFKTIVDVGEGYFSVRDSAWKP